MPDIKPAIARPETELMTALNSAAARLQRAAHSRQEVFDAFADELRLLGLRGGIHLLTPDGTRLEIASLAIAPKLIKALESLTRMKILGYTFPVESMPGFEEALTSGVPVFMSDTSEVVTALLPEKARRHARKILELVGNAPGVYAPLVASGHTLGVLNVESPEFSPDVIPTITAFANHLAVALHNAQLIAALRLSEELAQDTLDALDATLAVLDEKGEILAVNRAWVEFGHRNGMPEGAGGVGVNYLALCEQTAGEESNYARDMAQGIRSVMAGEIPRYELIYPCHSPDEHRWYAARVTRFRGEVCRVVVAHHDITRRVLAEHRKDEMENQLRSMVNSMHAAMFIYEPQAERFLFGNAELENLTGYTTADLQDARLQDLVHSEDWARIRQRAQARRAGESSGGRTEMRLVHRDGQTRWVEYTTAEIEYDGHPTVLGTAFDITERKQAEAALLQSEERFRTLIETVSAATFIFKGDMMTYVNRRAEELTGYSREELLQKTFWELIHPEMQAFVKERGQARQRGEDIPSRYEVRLQTKTGETCWVEFTGTLMDVEGEPAVLGTAFEVTQRKLAEAALQEGEERFRTLVQNASEAIVILDVSSLNFIEANPAAEMLYGLSRAELLQTGPVALSPPNQPDGRASAAAAAEYVQRAVAGETPVFEWLHTAADGRTLLCEVRLVRLPGQVPQVRGSLTDISARASIDQQLRLQSKALEAAAEAMLITDAEGMIAWVNPAFTRLTGYLPEDAIGQRPSLLKSGQTPPEVFDELWQTIKAGAIWEGEMINRRKDGSLYTESQVITPVFNDQSRIAHYISIKRDVTARRQRERRLQAIAQVSQALRQAESYREISATALEQVTDLLEARAVSLTLLDADQGDYVLEAATGQWAQYIGTRFQPGESVTGALILQPQTYINNDLTGSPDPRFTRPEMWGGMTAAIALPLEAHGVVLGVLWVGRDRAFRADDQHVLEAIANITASALHRAELHETTERLFDETRSTATVLAQQVGELERAKEEINRQNLELSRLYRASEALLTGTTPDLRTLAVDIVQSVLDEFGQSNCSIILVRPGERELERLAVGGEYAEKVRQARLFLDGKGLVPRAIQNAAILNVGDVHSMPDYIPNWEAARSEIAIPLRVGERILGVIDVQSAEADAFSAEDERVLALFAERASLAIENARLFEDARLHLGQLQALRDIDIAITSSLDIQLTLKVLLDQVLMQLNADATSVLLLQGGTLVYSAGRGFKTKQIEKTRLRLGEGYAGQAALNRQLVTVRDLELATENLLDDELFRLEGFRAYFGAPLVAKGEVLGVLEIFHRSVFEPSADWTNFLLALAEQAAIAVSNAELFDRLQRAKTELEVAYSNTLRGWVQALDLRDKETEGHTQRVTELCAQLAVIMGIPAEEMPHITRGALLHDIGKMAIPDAVLLKPGPLTPEERLLIQKHTDYAREFLDGIDYLKPALDIPYAHHERWDGSGYPRGLKGTEIPLTARIFAVVDVWDALTSDRPYRKAWTRDQTIDYLKNESGRLFDAEIVARFIADILHEQP